MNPHPLFVVAVVLALAPSCHRGSDGPSSAAIARSDELTSVAVGEVLAGNHDFAVIQGRLVEALANNSGNHGARLFLGVVNVLAAAEASLMEPSGHLHAALARSGYVNTDTCRHTDA